jgi:hypothetical protein
MDELRQFGPAQLNPIFLSPIFRVIHDYAFTNPLQKKDHCPKNRRRTGLRSISHSHFDNRDTVENLFLTIDYAAVCMESSSNSVIQSLKYLIQKNLSLPLEKNLRLLATGRGTCLD